MALKVHFGKVDRADTVLNDYQTEQELATDLDICVKTLRRWHAARCGPPRVEIGRRAMYRRTGVREWLIARERNFDDQRHPRGPALRR
jgi:hypothetical protein